MDVVYFIKRNDEMGCTTVVPILLIQQHLHYDNVKITFSLSLY